MTPAVTADRAVPSALLGDLRAARGSSPDQMQAVIEAWNLQPLTGARNNDVFAWDGTCIKLYRRTDRRRVEREWHGLTHVAQLDIAPRPLWLDADPNQPAIGMTMLSGRPAGEGQFPVDALGGLAFATRNMQQHPLSEPLAGLARVDSIAHYIDRLTTTWPAQLADSPPDEHTPEMLTLLGRWRASTDAQLLSQPAPAVYSRGDSNLLNWLHDGSGQLQVVDFEFSGYSDPAVDAADHVEHISAHHIPEAAWLEVAEELGVERKGQARFDAARRTIAMRWLAVLWKQRHHRTAEFLRQHDRVRLVAG